jgi:short-subunit dehydrogenase
LSDTNVGVTVVFPGATETNISENSGVSMNQEADSESAAMKALPASEAAKIIIDAIEKDKYRVFVGQDSKMMDLMYRISPKRAAAFISKQMQSLLTD